MVKAARRLRQRLGRHLDALEAGEVGAVDDVATVLRTLLGHGDGNDAIKRLCRMRNVGLPRVQVSVPIADDPQIGLAFGAVPAPSGGDEPVVTVDVDRWRRLPAVIIRGAPRRVSTWEKLIKDYANTFGSHLSETIPQLLSHTSSIGYSGPLDLDLGEYLIHCAGIVGEDTLQQVLACIDGDMAPPPRHRRLNPLLRLLVGTHANPQMITGYTLLNRPTGMPVQIAKLRVDGVYYLLKLTPTDTDEMAFDYEVTDEKPEWWPEPKPEG